MKVWEPSAPKKSGQTFLIEVDRKEGSEIIVALDEYCNQNKRKKNIKKILKQLENELAIY